MLDGVKAMGDSKDGTKYWTSREKWVMFQHFIKLGYQPTKLGIIYTYNMYYLMFIAAYFKRIQDGKMMYLI